MWRPSKDAKDRTSHKSTGGVGAGSVVITGGRWVDEGAPGVDAPSAGSRGPGKNCLGQRRRRTSPCPQTGGGWGLSPEWITGWWVVRVSLVDGSGESGRWMDRGPRTEDRGGRGQASGQGPDSQPLLPAPTAAHGGLPHWDPPGLVATPEPTTAVGAGRGARVLGVGPVQSADAHPPLPSRTASGSTPRRSRATATGA